ncbi:hypothetical protein N7519_004133 [Penicillium mononematosum]|uniref:uncharacterized protein n=1 Tax=Penicillium mononematosum TaxID=268346 RepID=UPI002547A535|nr:uncharacterized protein N7519_004133 [Penicillium mononematosum]KAJ6189225.1 hypothetical protein N7519_004133 [Penicillium mononematosum]
MWRCGEKSSKWPLWRPLLLYLLCTAFVRSFGDKTWSISIPELSRNTLGGSVFEHIQNSTLGVRNCPPSYRFGC